MLCYIIYIFRLVLHQAAKVRNEKTETNKEYFVVIFFMQGKDSITTNP